MRHVCLILCVLVMVGCESPAGGKPGRGKMNPSRGRAQFAVLRARAFIESPEFEREYQDGKPQPTPDKKWDNEFGDRIRVPAGVAPVEEPEVAVESPVPGKPVITVAAPLWCVPAYEFRKWLDEQTPETLEQLPFTLDVIPDEDIPAEIATLPSFDWEGGHIADWVDIDTLIAQFQATQQPQAFTGPKKRDREDRRDDRHDERQDDRPALPYNAGALDGLDALPDIIGDGLTLVRTASSDIKIPSSWGSHILIPTNTQVTVRHSNGVTTMTVDNGAPKLIFPLKLWSITIRSATLVGNQLTVQLDGWKDYTMVINWGQ